MHQFHYAQLRYLAIIALTWLAVFFLTRTVLLVSHWTQASLSLTGLPSLYGIGLVYDLAFLLYALAPMA
ncbi:MAG: LTA synthase family protein, partial [Gammaproteobacteria bacterium]|nr:LTA synthase family protein [Gammaproteobacteria bacterium]